MEAHEKPHIGDVLEFYFGNPIPTGSNGRAKLRCFFHDDGHASASVDHGRNTFRCFTCSIGLDSFAIIMEQESVGFIEAKNLAIERGWLSGESTTPAPMQVGESRAGRVKRRRRKR